mmetsp:Transcript_8304/g.13524  ORF Transcript_8304/g.13524 Transcript_8304/m.13524 type:complete len:268 (+) Transcript_8304:79-882(+)|eukprot:CAMPEP_0184667594 /NCGR_PEP_ID=MMETSP0308-20130426/68313_1 /TAXON_ID=38269 /ORGANISM="Gloeochaete witrockiana, Strain SAG 46.84" /LENGTH=267 /DNA_ID=CAMNT_0027112895 /DNA_START=46 /DNA_END=849 /DNA_ORIENTATION=-
MEAFIIPAPLRSASYRVPLKFAKAPSSTCFPKRQLAKQFVFCQGDTRFSAERVQCPRPNDDMVDCDVGRVWCPRPATPHHQIQLTRFMNAINSGGALIKELEYIPEPQPGAPRNANIQILRVPCPTSDISQEQLRRFFSMVSKSGTHLNEIILVFTDFDMPVNATQSFLRTIFTAILKVRLFRISYLMACLMFVYAWRIFGDFLRMGVTVVSPFVPRGLLPRSSLFLPAPSNATLALSKSRPSRLNNLVRNIREFMHSRLKLKRGPD